MPTKKETPQQKWAKKNRDKLAAACRRWRARHPERQKAATYRWRQKHLKEWNVYQRKWRERNPDLVRFAARRRWLKIKKNPKRYAKQLAASRKWAVEHAEAIRRKAKAFRKKNLHKVRAYSRRWMKRWYRANLREARKRLNAYRRSNPEKWRAYDRKIYRTKLRTNRDWYVRKLAKGRAWAKKNPEKQRHRTGRYRVRKLRAPGSHTPEQWLRVVRTRRWRCFYCGKHLSVRTLTKDHRIPLSKGGSDFAKNLVPACKACNSGKAGRLTYGKRRKR
jgi:5-methylcytosine-specific restriction endonuclease McrA